MSPATEALLRRTNKRKWTVNYINVGIALLVER